MDGTFRFFWVAVAAVTFWYAAISLGVAAGLVVDELAGGVAFVSLVGIVHYALERAYHEGLRDRAIRDAEDDAWTP